MPFKNKNCAQGSAIIVEQNGVAVNNSALGLNFTGTVTVTDDPSGVVTVDIVGDGSGGQVNSVVGGTNITVNSADPVNPTVNLDASISGMTVNGVVLTAAGVDTNVLAETGAYVSIAGLQKAIYTEIGTLEIDISVAVDTPIVSTAAIGATNGVNLTYNQSNQQIAIDLTAYAGTNNNLNIDQRIESYTILGGTSLAFGRSSLTPGAQLPIQYFSELPVIAPTPLVPMGSSFRFTPLDANNGEYMKYWCFLSDTGVNGFVGEFRLEIMKQSRDNNQNITIDYQFQKYS